MPTSICRRAARAQATFTFRPLPITLALTLLASTAQAQQAQDPAQIPAQVPAQLQSPAPSSTANNGDTPEQLDEIVVTANPLGRTADELVHPVNVLSGDELDSKRRGTIGETLEHEPGVSTTDFGAGAARPVIRGQAGPRVEVLENGMSTMDVSDLSPDHAVTIDTAQARQVEILKGPATLLYGNAASGGVVNVSNDRLPTEFTAGLQGEFDSSYGSNGDQGALSAAANYGTGSSMLHADLGWREAGNYDIPGASNVDGSGSQGTLANSHLRTTSGAAAYSYFTDAGSSFGISGSRLESNYGLPVEEEAFIQMQQTRFDAQATLIEPTAFLESLRLRGGSSNYEHIEFEAPGVSGTTFHNKQVQGRLEAVHTPWAGFRGVVGVQGNWRDFSALGEEAYVPPVESQQLGLFVIEERPYRLGKLELGARIEQDSNRPDGHADRDFTPFSYSLGSLFNLGESSHIKLYATHAERSPAPEELYAFGPHGATSTFERGNVDASNEQANNLEIGFDRHAGPWMFNASVYYNKVSNYLFLSEVDQGLNADGSGTPAADGVADRVDEGGNFDPDAQNILVDYRQADGKFFGYEAELSYSLLQSGPWIVNARLFSDQVRARLDDGQNLPRITPMRYGVGVDGSYARFNGDITYTRVDKQTDIAALETPTDGYDQLDANLSYRFYTAADGFNGASIYLRGTNLLDAEIRRATSFIKDYAPAPGRSLFVGLRMTY